MYYKKPVCSVLITSIISLLLVFNNNFAVAYNTRSPYDYQNSAINIQPRFESAQQQQVEAEDGCEITDPNVPQHAEFIRNYNEKLAIMNQQRIYDSQAQRQAFVTKLNERNREIELHNERIRQINQNTNYQIQLHNQRLRQNHNNQAVNDYNQKVNEMNRQRNLLVEGHNQNLHEINSRQKSKNQNANVNTNSYSSSPGRGQGQDEDYKQTILPYPYPDPNPNPLASRSPQDRYFNENENERASPQVVWPVEPRIPEIHTIETVIVTQQPLTNVERPRVLLTPTVVASSEEEVEEYDEDEFNSSFDS